MEVEVTNEDIKDAISYLGINTKEVKLDHNLMTYIEEVALARANGWKVNICKKKSIHVRPSMFIGFYDLIHWLKS